MFSKISTHAQINALKEGAIIIKHPLTDSVKENFDLTNHSSFVVYEVQIQGCAATEFTLSVPNNQLPEAFTLYGTEDNRVYNNPAIIKKNGQQIIEDGKWWSKM